MSANSLSGTLEPVALALGNHLWQSTLVAGVIALLTLALRKNRAQARYWLWLVASMKFLVPFSLFIILGGHLASLLHSTPPHQAAAESFVTIEQISQPFTNTPDFYVAQRPAAPAAQTSITDRLAAVWNREPLLPVALAGAWLIGFLVVTTRWTRRWLRIATVIQQTAPLHEGREFETLQRIRCLARLRQSIELRSLPASMEPGIFGIFRPVLLWPQAITERLEDTHLEAVVAHEVCHVRRSDNLTAAIHMVVEAIFWFHPLVWWLEARLVEERERACDEEVLQLCRQSRIYAESILKICEFCVETPLVCLSGVTGADLKKRIVQIMTAQTGRKLDLRRKLFLCVAAAIVVTLPVTSGLVRATQVRTQSAPAIPAGNIAATWQGTLDIGKGQRIVLKVTRAGDAGRAGWHGVAYNLDSGTPALGRNTTQMSFEGGVVRFTIAPIDASYEGELSADGASIVGALTQGGGQAHPLNLVRAEGNAAWAVPEPEKAMAKDADPDWDVVTVRPGDPSVQGSSLGMRGREFVIERHTVESMLMFGYGVHKKQIANLPGWAESELWDVKGVPDIPGKPSMKQYQSLTRRALLERFGLVTHTEQREMEVYAITAAKGGPKMTPSAGDPNGTPNESDNGDGGQRMMRMENASMGDLALMLKFMTDRPVVDQTGLTGRYDFELKWTSDEAQTTQPDAPPGLFTAIQEQMGLKLEPVKTMTDVMVIDKIEKPTPN